MKVTKSPVRIGIVGAGANSRAQHIPRLQRMDCVEIISIANRRRSSSESVARRFGIRSVYESWEELVSSPDSEAVVIGTWPYLHYPVTLAALNSGKHVMCEARMAMDASQARAMLAAAQRHPELVTQIVPSPFTLRVDNTVKRLIAEGYLGRVLTVEVRAMNGEFLDEAAPMHWRQDVDLSGLNVMSLGIWYEVLLRWIGDATRVTARGDIFVTTRRDPMTGAEKSVEIPEHLVVVADMSCGAQATFVLSTVSRHVQVNQIMLCGTEGSLLFAKGVLSGARGEDEFYEIPIPPQESGVWRVEEEFIAAIRGDEKITHTTFEDGVKYMEFTDAVARSLENERTESVIE